MPRTNIPVTVSSKSGTTLPAPTAADPVNFNEVRNANGKTLFIVKNTGASSRTITFKVSRTVDGQVVTSTVHTLTAGAEELFGPYDVDDYGTTLQIDANNAEVTIRPIESAD